MRCRGDVWKGEDLFLRQVDVEVTMGKPEPDGTIPWSGTVVLLGGEDLPSGNYMLAIDDDHFSPIKATATRTTQTPKVSTFTGTTRAS
jgi:hypothetical protein